MKDIVTIGEILIDLTYSGRENGIPVYNANPGGAPANVAVAAARLGADAAFIGKVGRDFYGDFLRKTASPIVTTGNELAKEQIADFSRRLNIAALYDYAQAVRESTDQWLRSIRYEDLKRRFSDGDRERIKELGVVSADESAFWLIDYWCGKDVAGLLKMPLSRHWIMHIEAAERIIGKITNKGSSHE